MAQRKLMTVEHLKEKRIDLLNEFLQAKTTVMKNNIHYRLKTVNKELFKRTQETKWL